MEVLEQAENRFILRDRKGLVRAELRVKARGRRELSLYDKQGNRRGGMTVRADGTTTLSLYGPAGETRVFLTKNADWPANLFLYGSDSERRVELAVPEDAVAGLSFSPKGEIPFVLPDKGRRGRPLLHLIGGGGCTATSFLGRGGTAVIGLRTREEVPARKQTSRTRTPGRGARGEIDRAVLSVEAGGVARLILRHRDRRLRGVLRVDADGELGLDLDD